MSVRSRFGLNHFLQKRDDSYTTAANGMMDTAAIRNVIAGLREEIARTDPRLLERHPVERYLAEMDAFPKIGSYRNFPPALVSVFEEIAASGGVRALALYHKLAIALFIERAIPGLPRLDVPDDVRTIVGAWFDRIVAEFSTQPDEYYDHATDLFCRDFSVACGRLTPIGCEVVELSRLGRRYLIGGGPKQAIKALRYVLTKTRALNPLYLHRHMDNRYVKDFDIEGVSLCCRRLADMCARDPRVAGIAAASWFFDPKVAEISPRLGWTRRLQDRHGAVLFRIGVNEAAIRLATTSSEQRKRLYEEGKYTPTHYLAVWPRKDLIAWAKRQERPFELAAGVPALRAKIRELEEELKTIDPKFFRTHPIELYVEQVLAYPKYTVHRYTSPALAAGFDAVKAAYGERALALFHRLAIALLIKESLAEIRNRRLPESVLALYREWFDRIVAELSRLPDSFYDHRKDLFCKDLAVASLRLIPVGFLVDVTGVEKSFLMGGGPAQLLKGLGCLFFSMRGIRPYYGIHMDTRGVRRYFNPEGWRFNYLRIAELLEMNPGIKGITGGSWFYDPELERVSPHLAHLRSVPVAYGACVFRAPTTPQDLRLAIANSPHRTKLYLDGLYRPAHYNIVWPREGILRYAAEHRREERTP